MDNTKADIEMESSDEEAAKPVKAAKAVAKVRASTRKIKK